MRLRLAFVLVVMPLVAGCTAYIPVRDDFGTSALVPGGPIPPEFAEFNAYDPRLNGLLADQICATPYALGIEKTLAGEPGQVAVWQGRCQTYAISFSFW